MAGRGGQNALKYMKLVSCLMLFCSSKNTTAVSMLASWAFISFHSSIGLSQQQAKPGAVGGQADGVSAVEKSAQSNQTHECAAFTSRKPRHGLQQSATAQGLPEVPLNT